MTESLERQVAKKFYFVRVLFRCIKNTYNVCTKPLPESVQNVNKFPGEV